MATENASKPVTAPSVEFRYKDILFEGTKVLSG